MAIREHVVLSIVWFVVVAALVVWFSSSPIPGWMWVFAVLASIVLAASQGILFKRTAFNQQNRRSNGPPL